MGTSDEPKPSSSDATAPDGATGRAERGLQRAEIVHPDGTREQVELHAEQTWTGILPRPQDFGRYGDVVPDAPERLLRMAELEQRHRIEAERARLDLDRQIVPASLESGKRGQWLGASLSALALILAAVTAAIGVTWQVPVALVGVPVLAVARSLVLAIRTRDE